MGPMTREKLCVKVCAFFYVYGTSSVVEVIVVQYYGNFFWCLSLSTTVSPIVSLQAARPGKRPQLLKLSGQIAHQAAWWPPFFLFRLKSLCTNVLLSSRVWVSITFYTLLLGKKRDTLFSLQKQQKLLQIIFCQIFGDINNVAGS